MLARFFTLRERRRMEAGLDAFLSFFLIELETRGSFNAAWQSSIQRSPSPLREGLTTCYTRYHAKGMPLRESVALFLKDHPSTKMKRALGMVEHVYVHGDSPAGRHALRRLIAELRHHSRVEWKTYSQKLVLFSVVFIGVSTLVPALFLAFVTIGGRFLELSITPLQILWVSWVGFPFVDTLLLVWVSMQTPVHVRAQEKNTGVSFSFTYHGVVARIHVLREKIHRMLLANGVKEGFPTLMRASVIEGCGLFLIAWTFFLRQPLLDATWLSVLVGAAAGPGVVQLAYHLMRYELNTRQMEEQAADSLSLFVALPATLPFVHRLAEVENFSPPPLHEEWKRIHGEIIQGKNVGEALLTLGKERDSRILENVGSLLARAYESGHSIEQPALSLAEEIVQHHASEHERRAVLFVEKSTLLLAGGLLVPFLLGILSGVVTGLPLGYEMDAASSVELGETTLLSIRGYLFLYALLASVFVGFQDHRMASVPFYMVVLVPAAQLTFTLGMWWMSA